MKKVLKPRQQEELLKTLKTRFEKNINRHKGLIGLPLSSLGHHKTKLSTNLTFYPFHNMRTTSTIYILVLFLLSWLLTSCTKDDKVDPPDGAAFSGAFVSVGNPTSGNASINEEETILTLTNFKTDTGPDLDIYLASDIDNVAADFINLGDIKGVTGNYTYDLPGQIDFLVYKYVIVWCVPFEVNFGYAEVTPL